MFAVSEQWLLQVWETDSSYREHCAQRKTAGI